MHTLLSDIRYGIRMLWKSPGFTAVAVITLALGIGANTAIFSLVNAVLLRPLPYPQPDQLLFLSEYQPATAQEGFSIPDIEDVERQAVSFQNVGWYFSTHSVYGQPAGSERVEVTYITHGLLPAVGVQPSLGKGFSAADDQAGGGHTALVSYSFWQDRLGGDSHVLGRTLAVDGKDFTVTGVLPRDFWFHRGGEVWLPLGAWPYPRVRDDHWSIYGIGRLKPGVTLPAAKAELDSIAQPLQRQYPASNALISMRVEPYYDQLVGNIRPALLLLLAAVGFVLLIACVNVANLLLAQATVRQREVAIRTALGAPVSRIVRQLLTESVLLSLLGGLAALVLASWSSDFILRLGGYRLPRTGPMIDHSVLWFTFGITLLAGIGFGLLPALRAARQPAGLDLREGRTYTAGAGRVRLRSALMLAEVALSVVLLVAAGLLIKSFARLRGVDPGFDPHHLLTVGVSIPLGKYQTDNDKVRFEQHALQQVAAIPGVQSAAMTRALPIYGDDWSMWFWPEGEAKPPAGRYPMTYVTPISPDYFTTLKVALLAGRSFSESDRDDSLAVVIVDETFARKYWPHKNAIGQHVNFPEVTPGSRLVVGVAAAIKNDRLEFSPREQIYVPYSQTFRFHGKEAVVPWITLLCRIAVPPLAIGNVVKRKLQEVDPSVAVVQVSTMDEQLSESISDRHFSTLLLGLFSGLALLLAAVGIYGVISFSVSQRTHEIGLRMALGAQLAQVQWMVVRSALKTVLAGLAIGALISLLSLRLISSLLFGVHSGDPEVLALVALVLLAVGVGAAFFPARRAAKVDPLEALRYE
ncbi:MAG TPA: ABC transporter permease [Terriglobales bacterium]|nr:ABC transporter permease [Terriglobales bacterium]